MYRRGQHAGASFPNSRRGIEAAPAPGRMAAITYHEDNAEEETAAPALG
jgi:hypothetical protein